MRAAVEHHFSGLTGTGITGGTGAGYDSSKTMISSLLRQATGANYEDKYISAKPSAIVNIPEVFTSGTQAYPFVYKWSDNIYWIFTASNATAAATRTIALTEFNSTNSTLTYKGFITLLGTTVSGSKTVRSLRAIVYKHTTGTVSTSGSSTTISGSGTGFTDERIAVGARIGFGTTDPTAVTTWYEITAITDNTTLTINAPVTLSAGTSYVIEEIRIALACTQSGTGTVVLNSGLHYIKGLNYSTFANGGTNIPEATTVDNIRASYLLTDARINGDDIQTFTVTIASPAVVTCNSHGLRNGDVVILTTTGALPTGLVASPTTAATQYFVINASTNTFNLSTTLNGTAINTSGSQSGTHTLHSHAKNVSATLALDDEVSKTDHSIYMVSTYGTSCSITEYNLRAALTVGAMGSFITAGTSTSAYVLSTTTQAVTGTPSQVNSGRIFTVNHGSASGVKSLWFVTTTRVYRVPDANITDGSVNWLEDAMLEVPPGGSVTYSGLNTMSQVDYSSTIDRLFITYTGGRFGVYVTPYVTDGSQFEKYVGANLNRVKLTTTPSGASDGLFPQTALTLWTEDGWMFAIPNATTSGQNWLYVFPFGMDAYYNSTTNQHIITPKLATTGATKLYHAYVDHMEYAGDYGLGFPVESYKLWYRTSGIDDNSGAWTEVPVGADLDAAAVGDYIQFKIAFDILGEICAPTRIYSICCTYEDGSQDSHYQPSLTKSSATNRQFAWKQVSSWGGTIPNLQIRLYNTATNFLVLDDTVTGSASGTWEYSANGTSWSGWSAGVDTIGNYIRYTADSLPNNITVRALLTQA
jgi:hypothetical protein